MVLPVLCHQASALETGGPPVSLVRISCTSLSAMHVSQPQTADASAVSKPYADSVMPVQIRWNHF